MRRFLPLILGALFLFAGGAYFLGQNNGALPGVSMAQAQSADGELVLAPDMALGSPDAPITVIEYASYTCPHCANFHLTVFEPLKENYIDTGKIRFVHREVYFDRFGLWAAMVARCGGELRYFGMNDLLYSGQAEWIGSGEPQEVLDNLRKIGRTAGMGDDQLNACLEDKEMAQGMVAAYQQNAEADGINATPTFIIDGEKFPNMGYDEFAAILDAKLEP